MGPYHRSLIPIREEVRNFTVDAEVISDLSLSWTVQRVEVTVRSGAGREQLNDGAQLAAISCIEDLAMLRVRLLLHISSKSAV